MYKNQRRIKELTPYIPAVDIFRIYEGEPGAAFLDSSLVNELGHYSVIGRCPYLKLVKDGENFTINGRPETETTFEDYMREYLNTHEDKNNSGLPIVSGAVGYFSYDYGRKQMGVPSGEKDLVTVPEAVLTFYDCFIIEDCQEKRTYLVSNGISADAAAEIGAMEKAIREFTEAGIYMTVFHLQKTFRRCTDDLIISEIQISAERRRIIFPKIIKNIQRWFFAFNGQLLRHIGNIDIALYNIADHPVYCLLVFFFFKIGMNLDPEFLTVRIFRDHPVSGFLFFPCFRSFLFPRLCKFPSYKGNKKTWRNI